MLKAVAGIPFDEAHVKSAESPYIALRSIPPYVPSIPWTLFRAISDPSVPNDTVVVSSTSYNDIPIQTKYITPKTIDHVIITAPAHVFSGLKGKDIASQLPHLVRSGMFLDNLSCRIKACEPVDQGIIAKAVDISVICEPSSVEPPTEDLEIEEFLQRKERTLNVGLKILYKPIPAVSIQPRPSPAEDLENAAFLRVDQLARLGVFSGDLITLKTENSSRVVRLYAFPEPNTIGEDLYAPPMLVYNLGPNTKQVQILPEATPLSVSKDVTISRISSAVSTDRTYQQAFLSGLRTYFELHNRVVKNNDIIAVPIDTLLARTLFTGAEESTDLSLSGTPDTIVWFKISGVEEEGQFIIDHSQTRMVQSGYIQEKCPPLSLQWQKYYGLATYPPLLSYGSDNFLYAFKIHKLFRAALSTTSFHTTVLVTSSKRGAGKSTVLSAMAAELGINDFTIDCFEIIGDSDVKTIGTLRAKLDRASTIEPCLVTLKHLDAISRKSEQDGRDPHIVASLNETLDTYISKPNLIFAATTSDADKLTDSVRNKFKFEVDITVPTEKERKFILSHLTSSVLADSQLTSNSLLEGYELQGNISLDSLALQSAGLTPPDLQSIIRVARQQAHARIGGDPDTIICQRGIIKITNKDIEQAISDARAKYSDSIGAPKIPNVGWKDVGGLDGVKGEIMDTIEMPLKYPHLFASGVKKRSGILFYGPPGTGKTLMAKAIATSFSLNFFSVKGPELLNMYIGESEANVRRVFQKAREAKPCVVFFDELDSVAPKRGNQGDSGGVMDRIVSQLLAELDGMSEGADGVFVIGATNRPDLLDEALLRPGRFDKLLYLGVSDTHAKQRTILEALTRKFDLSPQINLATIAEKCPFTFTGADFYAMSSDAMLNAMTRTAGEVDGKIDVYNKDLEAQGKPPIAIRAWFEHVASDQDTHVRVSEADFDKALAELVPSVSADELAHYMRIRNSFEGSKKAGDEDKSNEELAVATANGV